MNMHVNIALLLVGLLLSIYAYQKSRSMKTYTYLSKVFFINILVGFLFTIHSFIYSLSVDLYFRFLILSYIAAILHLIELFIYTHGNMNEALKKILPANPSIILLTPLLLGNLNQTITLTIELAVVLVMMGITIALAIELFFSTSKIYGLMKGGKLYALWIRILILAGALTYSGLAYTLIGVLAMSNLLPFDIVYFIVAISYIVASTGCAYLSRYYEREISPIVSKIL